MKSCAYCGHENDDGAVRCTACGTSDFVNRASAALPGGELENVTKPELLPRDRPKLVIVAGLWMIYGTGFVLNLMGLCGCLTGSVGGDYAGFGVPLFIGGIVLCGYLMRRALRNYHIQKTREAKGSLALSLEKPTGP